MIRTPARGLLSVFTLSLMLSSCTFGPREPIVPRDTLKDDEADARAVAYTGLGANEEFKAPAAQRVAEIDSEEQVAPAPQPAALQLGFASLAFGSKPPWASTQKLESAPELADAPTAPAPGEKLPTTFRLQKTIRVGQGYLYQAEFTPNQKEVITLSTDSGIIYRFDAKSGNPLGEIKLPDFTQFEDVAFAVIQEIPDRPQVIVARESGTSVLDLESGKFERLGDIAAGDGVAHSGRFGLYGVAHRKIEPQSGSLTLHWLSGKMALHLEAKERPDDWSLSKDGNLLALQYYPSNRTQLLDLRNKKMLHEFDSPQWGGSVALSPDGKVLALGGEKLILISLATGKVIAEDSRYGNNIDSIVFSPQADLLLVSAYDGMARSYALPADLSQLNELPAPQKLQHAGTANVYGLGLSANTRMLVTSSGDQTLKIWAR